MNFRQYINRFYDRRLFAALIIMSCIQGAVPAAQIWIRGRVIDAAVSGYGASRIREFLFFLLLFCLVSLGSVLAGAAAVRMEERHGVIVAGALDRLRVDKANRVRYELTETREFHDLFQKASQAPSLDEKCIRSVGELARYSVQTLASLAVILLIDWKAAAGILVLLAAGLGANVIHAARTEGFWEKYMENMRRANYLSDLLTQREYAAERKLFGYQNEVERRFNRQFAAARTGNIRMGTERAAVEMTIQVIFALYSAALVLLLIRPLLAGNITVGVFLSVFYGATGLIGCCNSLYNAAFTLSGSFAQMKGYFSFQELQEEAGEGRGEPEALKSIEFRNVSFSYPGSDRKVLDHLSFRLKPNKHYALVGENGSGKSTLVKLMTGLYSPTEGEILINGRNVRTYSRERLNRLFSVVFQDFYRYPLTVRENVSLSTEANPSEEKLESVFRTLRLDSLGAKLPRKYDTNLMILQQDGMGLSGGQWQKLTIARCILSDAPMAILDEPNASLDPVSEASIYRAYRKMLGGRTTLFISHRLGSVKMAEEILVLKDGGLLAKDSHEELMKNCPYYAELFNTQRELYVRETSEKSSDLSGKEQAAAE